MPELWIPEAIRKPIAQGSNDPYITPVGDIFHVAVSEAASLRAYFDGPSGGIESTGYIRRDGTIEQYRPFNVECDAQGDGNSWVRGGTRYGFNSWETQGMGDGVWTREQLAAIKNIIGFKHAEYGTPLRICPAWDAPGFGYHRLFARWNKNGHSCPGPERVQQFRNIIVPWMNQGGDGDDMPAYSDWPKKDRDALVHDVLDGEVENRNANGKPQGTSSLRKMITNVESSVDQRFQQLNTKLDAILAQIKESK